MSELLRINGRFAPKQKFNIICKNCGKQFIVQYWRRKDAKFCCNKCSQEFHKGVNHSMFGKHHNAETINRLKISQKDKHHGALNGMWNGGVSYKHGYRIIQIRGKGVYEHRIIAENILNRKLLKTEVIHHINGNKTDNNQNNLYLFSSASKHIKYHKNLKNNKNKLISNLFYSA